MSTQLSHHLAEKHNISPLSTYLREIVYGGTDGIVTTFAVVAGFAGAESQSVGLPILTVLLFGFANLAGDGVSMALGNFLSTMSEHDVFRNEEAKERYEIEKNPESEKEETIDILMEKGFTRVQATTMTEIYMTNPPYWLEFMMKDELSMSDPSGDKPIIMSLATFFSFLLFGLLPLIPYVLFRTNANVFLFSILTTAGSLMLLGVLRYRVTKQSFIRSVSESLLLGGIAASVAFGVGRLIKI